MNDISKHLEEDDAEQQIWQDAHNKYDDGNIDPLKMQYHLKEMEHGEKVKAENSSKGEYFNYSRDFTLLTGTFLTAATFKIHALFATTVIGAGYKILTDSLNHVDGKDENFYEKLDSFGLEFPYYIIGAATTAYLLYTISGERIVLENAGTVATATSEVITLAQAII